MELSLQVAGGIDDMTPDSKGIHMGLSGTNKNDPRIELVAGDTNSVSMIDFTVPNVDRHGRIRYDYDEHTLLFEANSTAMMKFFGSGSFAGRVGIGTVLPQEKVHINGVCRATSFTTTSDDRVKHNETDISNSLAIISQLNPKRYLKTNEMYDSSFNIATDDLKEGDSISEEYGVIAQDLLGIDDLSFLVKQSIDASGNEIAPMALDYQSLFVLAIKGIQELQARIETLEAMI